MGKVTRKLRRSYGKLGKNKFSSKCSESDGMESEILNLRKTFTKIAHFCLDILGVDPSVSPDVHVDFHRGDFADRSESGIRVT